MGGLEVVGILGSADKSGGDLVLRVIDLVVTMGVIVMVVVLVKGTVILIVESTGETSTRSDIMNVCWDVA